MEAELNVGGEEDTAKAAAEADLDAMEAELTEDKDGLDSLAAELLGGESGPPDLDLDAMEAELSGGAQPEPEPEREPRELAGWLAARGHGAQLAAIETAMAKAEISAAEIVPLLAGMNESELAEFLGSCVAEEQKQAEREAAERKEAEQQRAVAKREAEAEARRAESAKREAERAKREEERAAKRKAETEARQAADAARKEAQAKREAERKAAAAARESERQAREAERQAAETKRLEEAERRAREQKEKQDALDLDAMEAELSAGHGEDELESIAAELLTEGDGAAAAADDSVDLDAWESELVNGGDTKGAEEDSIDAIAAELEGEPDLEAMAEELGTGGSEPVASYSFDDSQGRVVRTPKRDAEPPVSASKQQSSESEDDEIERMEAEVAALEAEVGSDSEEEGDGPTGLEGDVTRRIQMTRKFTQLREDISSNVGGTSQEEPPMAQQARVEEVVEDMPAVRSADQKPPPPSLRTEWERRGSAEVKRATEKIAESATQIAQAEAAAICEGLPPVPPGQRLFEAFDPSAYLDGSDEDEVKQPQPEPEPEPEQLSFTVHVIRARNLAKMDLGGKSDPYVVLHCGDTVHKTEVVKKSLDPEWTDARFQFDASGAGVLTAELFDWDRGSKDDPMGRVSVPLAQVDGEKQWLTLQPMPGCKRPKGEMLLRLTSISADTEREPDPSAHESETPAAVKLPEGDARIDRGSASLSAAPNTPSAPAAPVVEEGLPAPADALSGFAVRHREEGLHLRLHVGAMGLQLDSADGRVHEAFSYHSLRSWSTGVDAVSLTRVTYARTSIGTVGSDPEQLELESDEAAEIGAEIAKAVAAAAKRTKDAEASLKSAVTLDSALSQLETFESMLAAIRAESSAIPESAAREAEACLDRYRAEVMRLAWWSPQPDPMPPLQLTSVWSKGD